MATINFQDIRSEVIDWCKNCELDPIDYEDMVDAIAEEIKDRRLSGEPCVGDDFGMIIFNRICSAL